MFVKFTLKKHVNNLLALAERYQKTHRLGKETKVESIINEANQLKTAINDKQYDTFLRIIERISSIYLSWKSKKNLLPVQNDLRTAIGMKINQIQNIVKDYLESISVNEKTVLTRLVQLLNITKQKLEGHPFLDKSSNLKKGDVQMMAETIRQGIVTKIDLTVKGFTYLQSKSAKEIMESVKKREVDLGILSANLAQINSFLSSNYYSSNKQLFSELSETSHYIADNWDLLLNLLKKEMTITSNKREGGIKIISKAA